MNDTALKLREGSFTFAVRIVKLSRFIEVEKRECVLARQILRSGTSVGANVRESRFAQSDADFVSKLSIALKEAEETAYWLELLHATEILTKAQFESLSGELDGLIGTMVNVVKSCKSRIAASAFVRQRA